MFESGDIVYFNDKFTNEKIYGIFMKEIDGRVYANWDLRTIKNCINATEREKNAIAGCVNINNVFLHGGLI